MKNSVLETRLLMLIQKAIDGNTQQRLQTHIRNLNTALSTLTRGQGCLAAMAGTPPRLPDAVTADSLADNLKPLSLIVSCSAFCQKIVHFQFQDI